MPKNRSRPWRFTSLRLENWRNFSLVEGVRLQQRVFLVGPNASGKSNLLDAFRFLRDVVSVGGGFQEAVRRRGGVSKLRCLAARRNPDVALRIFVGNGENEAAWEYELAFSQEARRLPLIRRERVVRDGAELLARPDANDQRDPARLSQTYLEQVHANREFRELATFMGTVQYLHIVPQLIREPDRSVGRANDPFGGDFMERIARTPERTRTAWLGRIEKALRFAVPQLKELRLVRDERGTPHLQGKYEHWRPRGAWQTEEQLSDGTLRLLGLLWSLLEGSGPLLLEEPELSLHPEVVRFLPQMFARVQGRSGRQVFISSHSSDLLRDEGIGLDEVLLLQPGAEGTKVMPAGEIDDVRALLEGGVPLSDVLLPRTRPDQVQQLMLFE